MMNSADEGESQFAQGFDLASYLESTSMSICPYALLLHFA
jgi:hypothetical protein